MRIAIPAALLCLSLLGACARADRPAPSQPAPSKLPDAAQAGAAIAEMFGDPALARDVAVVLGTCIPAVGAEFPGQTACTVKIQSGAGASETQADFYWNGERWIAVPSQSQGKLPFPDPKLG
ncbi:hypothetical protein A7A76_04350 [Lysobacter enzymogenes]|uniref:hypothetical protein n=1 Tax=Lysobacter enzymogenes TaxID=69 RepID=UPI0019D21C48|nr:hypothetical protein [Lysobacter enzymogenes]MBN7138319.1 hypothetical protein [Lysobacter enzymogenes]